MALGSRFTGCAGWSLATTSQPAFGPGDSHLQRYATRLNCVEINSSFYRPHSRATYQRWADCVPANFRFSVKLPKAITHERRLVACEPMLDEFVEQAQGLGPRLGCLLVQLPPSLVFNATATKAFFKALRGRHAGGVAVEPRHASWFEPQADALLRSFQATRVLADPVRHPAGCWPGGWTELVYLRLHGSPRMYYSAYDSALIGQLALRIQCALGAGQTVWCVFDNTASGAATDDALALSKALLSLKQTPST